MSLKLAYKIFIIAIILLCARTGVWAQGEFVVLNSTHTYKVPNVIEGNLYKWSVLDKDGNPLKFKKVDDSYLISEDGSIDPVEGVPVKIKWEAVEIGKKYTLVLTEEVIRSRCSVDSEMEITIINSNLSVDFAKGDETRCAEEGNDGFIIPLVIKSLDVDDAGDISQSYPLTMEFYMSYNGGTEELITMKLESGTDITYVYDDRRPGFKEDQTEDHIFKFRLKSMKDKYGAEMKVNPDSKFIFKAVSKPKVGDIQFD